MAAAPRLAPLPAPPPPRTCPPAAAPTPPPSLSLHRLVPRGIGVGGVGVPVGLGLDPLEPALRGFEIFAFPCNQFGGQELGIYKEIVQIACMPSI